MKCSIFMLFYLYFLPTETGVPTHTVHALVKERGELKTRERNKVGAAGVSL